jgi:hypothetical protein
MARHRRTTPITVRLGVRTAADVRAFVYQALPVVATLLVGLGVATTDQAALWAGLVTAVAGPGLAWWKARSLSTLRPALYAVAVAGQGVAIGYGLYSGSAGVWLPVVTAVIGLLGGGLAVANTATSSGWTRNVNGEPDPTAPVVR